MITINSNIKHIITPIKTLILALAMLSSGCANLKQIRRPQEKSYLGTQNKKVFIPKPLLKEQREQLAQIAKSFIGKSSLKVGPHSFRSDCSGAVRAIFATAKLRLGGIIKKAGDNDVKTIYRFVQKYGRIIKNDPEPGDLVFFHNTYDRSRNGRMNDALTHIGIIEKVEGNNISFVHHLGQSIIRSRMNLKEPTQSIDPKNHERINHILRKARGRERAYTAAELFAGFGRL